MNEVLTKTFEDRQVRVQLREGEPWFVAQDVCEILELKHVATALKKLESDERVLLEYTTQSGNQQLTCVNESGLYSLIMRSKKPAAKEFRRWVTREVLPSIRKTGHYIHEPYREMDALERLEMYLNAMKEQRDRAIAESKRVDSIAQQLCVVAHEAKQENDTLTHDQISELDSLMNSALRAIGDRDFKHLSRMKTKIKKDNFKIKSTRTYKEIPRSGFERAKQIIAQYVLDHAASDSQVAFKSIEK